MTTHDVAALFRAHNIELFRYLLRLTGGDEATARDVVQHAYLTLMDTPSDVAHPRAWLYRVATTTLHEWTGKERRREELMTEHADDLPLPATPEPPDQAVDRSERIEDVRAALATLTDKERAVLLMREEGFRHHEIADAVGTTTGSVGTMIARALDRLAGRLALDEEVA